MVKKRAALSAAPFQGRWRIADMDNWPDEAFELLGPAFLQIDGQNGEMRFYALTARLDTRFGARGGEAVAEFSWQGEKEGEPCSGRGWMVQGTAGRLVGHVFIHMAEDWGFVCEPW